jgi:hypothetical protein
VVDTEGDRGAGAVVAGLRAAAAVGLLVASMLALGCRGEDDETRTQTRPAGAKERTTPARTGPAPTRPRFTREANAACADAKRRAAPIAGAVAAKVREEDAAGVAEEVRKTLPIAEELLEKLGALTPPAGDEAVIGEYLDLVARQKERIRPLAEAVEAEDISTIEVLLAEVRAGNRRARRVARDYGLTQCEPPGLPTTG